MYPVDVCVYCDIGMHVLIAAVTVKLPLFLHFHLFHCLWLFILSGCLLFTWSEQLCLSKPAVHFSQRLYASVAQTLVAVCARDWNAVSLKGGNVFL